MFTYLVIISPEVVRGYMSRKTPFIEERSTQVINSVDNFVKSPLLVRSLIGCGVLCDNDEECDVAEYNHITTTCLLYKDMPFNSLATQPADGFTTIKADRKAFKMKFDPATLRSNLYMSPDQTTISDYAHAGVQQFPTGPDTLTYYPGVIVDNCIKTNQIIHYTIDYEYTIETPLTSTYIAIEFGIAERAQVDNSVYAGSKNVGGRSFPINKCQWDELCLEAWHNSVGLFETGWSSNSPGHYQSGSFLFVVNRRGGSFTLYKPAEPEQIFQITGVASDEELCPTFSVQGKFTGGMTSSQIRLVNAQEVL